jgi:hypothetical protein
MKPRNIQSKIIASAFAILLAILSYAQPPDTLWTNTFGGTLDDAGSCVQPTNDGGYIISGTTMSFTIGGSWDVWLIKTDADGDCTWSSIFGGDDGDYGNCVQQTIPDYGYIITGNTHPNDAGNLWLIKTDDLGNLSGEYEFGGTGLDYGWSVQQTPSDMGYIITGATSSFGSGFFDVWLIKTDAAGDCTWSRTFGGTGYDEGHCIDITDDGGYIIAGTIQPAPAGHYDIGLIKTNADGDSIWGRTFGDTGIEYGYYVQQTTDGGYIVLGDAPSITGDYDIWLIKTDSLGNIIWDTTFGGVNNDGGRCVRQTDDGGYIITGFTESFGSGAQDVWIIKTDSEGALEWEILQGGSGVDSGHSIKQTEDKGYILTGQTTSFGVGGTGHNVWLIRLADPVTIVLTPYNPPIIIPEAGGVFDFNVLITNNTNELQRVEFWTVIQLPGAGEAEILNIPIVPIQAHNFRDRDFRQEVPPFAPPGTYMYSAYIGEQPWIITNYDYFTFEKEGNNFDGELGSPSVWPCTGDPFDDWFATTEPEIPQTFAISAYPNPFNPTTVISYQLSVDSHVNLVIYDISGRKVAELVNGWRDAGYHEVAFDGSDVPSGVYIFRIQAGEFTAVGKLIMMK